MLYKTIFLAVSLSLFSVHLSAQQFSLGVRGGYSISDLIYGGKPDNLLLEEEKPLPGFHAGIESRLDLSGQVALLIGLQYARKGYIGKIDWPTGRADASYILHYATLPVVGSFKIWKGLSVQAGLEAGWLLNSKGRSTENFDPEGFADLYNEFDLGVVGGLEYQFGKNFFLAGRYTLGVTPLSEYIFTSDNDPDGISFHAYNRSVQISAGYRYHFGK